MTVLMNEIYAYALKLLRGRDYTISKLCAKLEAKFGGSVPPEVIEQLLEKKFLNDRRFAENYIAKRKSCGVQQVREELLALGISAKLAEEIVSHTEWPSLQDALTAKMRDWNLRPPLQPRDAGRLFRSLLRLGYDEDAIREELEQLEQ